ncbi:hypothetical protein [Acinetobacter nosocomialis]|uniref:hypothetical protein n=1 Tax=Acinetobacter nosocomialis TaxID=106654 RepID=UPI00148F1B57|nr:hypothetical protein [Acinetobacter nosocomialis]
MDDEYVFIKLPNTQYMVNGYRSNGFTYTPNKIPYHDSIFIIYCNHDLNDYELKKLEEDWRKFCPN